MTTSAAKLLQSKRRTVPASQLAALGVLLCAIQPAAATIVFLDTFNRDGNLNGSAFTIQTPGGTWSAANWTTSSTTGGVASVLPAGGGGSNNAVSPTFSVGTNPFDAFFYTYTVWINTTNAPNAGDFMGMGFTTNSSTTDVFNSANHHGWMTQLAPSDPGSNQAWAGPGATNGGNFTVGGENRGLQAYTVVMSRTSASPTQTMLSFYNNGILVGGPTVLAAVNPTSLNRITIGQLDSASGTVQHLSLLEGNTWLLNTGGSFQTTGNWSGGVLPNTGANADINFGSTTGTNNVTITMDVSSARRTRNIIFANSMATATTGNYAITQGTGTNARLQPDTGITNHFGNNIIQVGVDDINNNGAYRARNNSSLTLNGGLAVNGRAANFNNVAGDTGTVIVNGITGTVNGGVNISRGQVILNGTSTYTSATVGNAITNVSGGILLVNGSLTATANAVTVNVAATGGGTLGGLGTIDRPVTFAAAASLAAGGNLMGGDGLTATGALTLSNNLTLNNNSELILTLGPGGTHSSIIRTGGTWAFDADQAFTFTDLGIAPGLYDNIISGLTGAEAGLDPASWLITNPSLAGIASFSYDGSGGIDLTVIPEPASAAFLFLAAPALFARRRRCAA